MYLPKQHEEARLDVLLALVQAHPLGVWVSLGPGGLSANHVPFEVDASRGEFGTLVGHVARANPTWKAARTLPDLVTFQGPQSYITPSWYPGKHEHGKAVPTWNYAVVHVHGVPTFIEDREWLLAHVNQLTNRHESPQALPWAVSDAPDDYIDKMLGAIVGVEIRIDRISGKWKMSQNRPVPDQMGVVAGLMARSDASAAGVARVIQDNLAARRP